MNQRLLQIFLVIVIFFVHHFAFGKINAKYSTDIEAACKKSSAKLKDKNLCACIAKSHFSSAEKEPNEAEALKQLQWVIDYYQTQDKKKLKVISEKPENLVDFDFMVVEDCLAGK